MEAKELLLLKEREVLELRGAALQELESKLAAKEQELDALNTQFKQLKDDFQFNLQLLLQRDEELGRYDEEHSALTALVADRGQQVTDLQASILALQAELRSTQAMNREAEFVFKARCSELQQLLDEERFAKAGALLRQKEQHEQAVKVLQRDLAAAEEQHRQRLQEMTAVAQAKAEEQQQAALQQLDALKQALGAAEQLAAQREREVKAAGERETAAVAKAEAMQAELRRHEQEVRALKLELEDTCRQRDAHVRRLQEQHRDAQQQLEAAQRLAEQRTGDAQRRLAAAEQALQEARTAAARDAAAVQRQHGEEVAGLKARLEQSAGYQRALEAELGGALELVKATRGEMEERVRQLQEQLRQERDITAQVVKQAEAERAAEASRAREEGARVHEDQLRALVDTVDELKAALEEQLKDTGALKDKLEAANQREQQLMKQLQQPAGARTAAPASAYSGADSPPAAQRRHSVSGAPQGPPQRHDDALAQSTSSPGMSPSRQAVGRGRPPHLMMASVAGFQDSHDSLPDMSPLMELPPSPRSSASFWLGPTPAPAQQPQAAAAAQQMPKPMSPAAAAAAAAAAARAAQFLRSSQEGIDALLRPMVRSRLAQLLTGEPPASPDQDKEAMRTALQEAAGQNDRLRSTLAAMRAEMEALQSAAGAAADGVLLSLHSLPHDAAALQVELQESDKDMQQLMEQLELLQRQLQAASAQQQAAAAGAGLLPADAELSYLRQRVKALMNENRSLRRQAMQLRAAAAVTAATTAGPGSAPAAAPTAAGPGPSASAHVQQEQAASMLQPPTGTAHADATAAANSQAPAASGGGGAGGDAAAVVARLRGQLRVLKRENERLMEMGNEVRAQRDRLAMQLAAMASGAVAAAAAATSSPTRAHSQEQQTPGPLALPGAWPWLTTPLQLPNTTPLLMPASAPSSNISGLSPLTGLFLQPPQLPAAAMAGMMWPFGPHLATMMQAHQAAAAAEAAASGPRPSATASPPSLEPEASSRRGSKSPQRGSSPNRSARSSPNRLRGAGIGGAFGPGALFFPARDASLSLSPTPSQARMFDAAAGAALTTTTIVASPRPAPPPGVTASGRETQSQKATLRALHQRRREQQQQPGANTAQAAGAAASGGGGGTQAQRQRVRNYNIRDDEEAVVAAH